MNILLIHHLNQSGESVTFGAVPYYRMQKPHEVLKRLYPEFDYITSDSVHVEESILKQTDLVLFTRVASQEDIEFVECLGLTWGVDIDDFWELPEEHLLYSSYKENDTTNRILNTINKAHFVICTTDILADKIKPLNQNVYVIENGIDSAQWVSNKIKSNRVRFGFTQGTTHINDIKLISDSVVKSLYNDYFYKNGQIVLCGFNANFNKPSVYVGYEKMLTDSLKPMLTLDKEYAIKLIKIRKTNGISKPYRRIEAVDVNQFYSIHNELDVVVAPLDASEFNSCKSNIKMLEAGFMDCGVMVHQVSPYKELMTKKNSFNLTENSFFDLQRYILENPNALIDSKLALKETVQPFELSRLTDKRKDLYLKYGK